MARHEGTKPVSRTTVTAMTAEGVSDPSLLSSAGQLQHAKRLGGPGTRSKNPSRYDRDADHYAAARAANEANRVKALKALAKGSTR